MTNRIEKAVSCFKEKFSCSQAVLSSYSDMFGLDRLTALRIAQPFGGGMAHRGETCGAVTGAFMVIGLKYGRTIAEDIEARETTYKKVHELVKRFSEKHGSIVCRELLGIDMSTEEGYNQIEELGLFDSLCPKFIRSATEILEPLLKG